MTPTLPLSPNAIFWTIQGEGILAGEPMMFVRLAGCSVGCADCDTDYSVFERDTVEAIARRVVAADPGRTKWVWVTGGEPTIHDLQPLVARLHGVGYRVALATAGVKVVQRGHGLEHDGATCKSLDGFDFVSVSPHRIDDSWVQKRGDQLNVVPGLNGVRLEQLEGIDVSGFSYRYVTPMWCKPADRMEKVGECVEWVKNHPGWRLGHQSHKAWNLA